MTMTGSLAKEQKWTITQIGIGALEVVRRNINIVNFKCLTERRHENYEIFPGRA